MQRGALIKPIIDAKSYAEMKQKLAEANVFYPIILDACLQGNHDFIREHFTLKGFEEFLKAARSCPLTTNIEQQFDCIADYIRRNVYYPLGPISKDFPSDPDNLEQCYKENRDALISSGKITGSLSLLSSEALIKFLFNTEERVFARISRVIFSRKAIKELSKLNFEQMQQIIFHELYKDLYDFEEAAVRVDCCFKWAEQLKNKNRHQDAAFLYKQLIIFSHEHSLAAMSRLLELTETEDIRVDKKFLKDCVDNRNTKRFALLLLNEQFDEFYSKKFSSKWFAQLFNKYCEWHLENFYDNKRKEKIEELDQKLFSKDNTQESVKACLAAYARLSVHAGIRIEGRFFKIFKRYVFKGIGDKRELKKQYNLYYEKEDIWKVAGKKALDIILPRMNYTSLLGNDIRAKFEKALTQFGRLAEIYEVCTLHFRKYCQEEWSQTLNTKNIDYFLSCLPQSELKHLLENEQDKYRQSRILIALIKYDIDEFLSQKLNEFPSEYDDPLYADLYFSLAQAMLTAYRNDKNSYSLEEIRNILESVALTGHQDAILLLGAVLRDQQKEPEKSECGDELDNSHVLIERHLGIKYILRMLNGELNYILRARFPQPLDAQLEESEKEHEDSAGIKDASIKQLKVRFEQCNLLGDFNKQIEEYQSLCDETNKLAQDLKAENSNWEQIQSTFFSLHKRCQENNFSLPDEIALDYITGEIGRYIENILSAQANLSEFEDYLKELRKDNFIKNFCRNEYLLLILRKHLELYFTSQANEGLQKIAVADFRQKYEELFFALGGEKALLTKDIFLLELLRGSKKFLKFSCAGFDFSNLFLSEADFTGSILRNANFQNADLCGANFQDTDLRGVNLIGAQLQDVCMDERVRPGILIDNLSKLGRSLSAHQPQHTRQLALAKKQARDLFDGLVLPMHDINCLLHLLDQFKALKHSDLKFLREERGFFGLFGRYGNTRTWSHCMVEVLESKVKQELAYVDKRDPRYSIYQQRLKGHLCERNTRFGL